MTVRYHERRGQLYPDYVCEQSRIEQIGAACQTIPGQVIDRAIERLALSMMTPVSLEIALAVQQEIVDRQLEAERMRAQQVERAQYQADLARQRYTRCDPNNRLVASSLEADWNRALRTLEQTQLVCEQQRDRDSLLITAESARGSWR